MKAQTLPAAAGWRWITGGLAIFRRNPPLLAMLVISYWFTLLLLNIETIDEQTAKETLHILLKYQTDIAKAAKELSIDK